MKKIRITKKAAKICDYTLWAIAVIMAFMVNWKAGVALLAFDAMRAFEDIQERISINESGKLLYDELVKSMAKDDKEAPK